jgi:tRNA threonylcarbamoyladenosine biosynthesis protein TsaB
VNQRITKAEPLILAIETATRAGGVAVARGEKVLASRTGDARVSHSMNLIEMIEEVLHQAGVRLSEVDLFAVAVGPGSFTGLRIGLATVKAFAAHLNRKVAGVSTLAAVAHASGAKGEIVSLLPAGRGEVFAQRFAVDEGAVAARDEARHLSPAAVMERYREIERLVLVGDGARVFEKSGVPPSGGVEEKESGPPKGGTLNLRASGTLNSQLSETLNEGWIILDESPDLASSIALLGLRNSREGKSVAPDELHAVYVRASDAEINEQWQRQKAQQPARD